MAATPHAGSTRPPVLRWLGLALALVAMLLGGLNLIVAPWGVGNEGTLLGFQVFQYLWRYAWLIEDFHPMYQYYLYSSGPAYLLFAIGLVYAVTAGVRANWARWLTFALQLLIALLLLLSAVGQYVSAADYAGDSVFVDEARTQRVTAFWLVGLVVIPAAAAVALAIRAHRLYDAIAVVAVMLLAILHLWSVAMAATIPDSDPSLSEPGLRLTAFAWTPAVWYLLAAVGAVVASVGAALARGSR